MSEGEAKWRRCLKRVPGLAPAYRALRSGWWKAIDAAGHAWWRLRAGLPLSVRAKHRTAMVWAEEARRRERVYAGEGTLWLDSTEVLRHYVFPQFEGKHWYQYVADKYCPEPRQRGLSLCCGDGEVERNLLLFGICQACEGIDISPEAIVLCRREAETAGFSDRLTYQVADAERAQLRRDGYDVVVAWMALHHIRRLEHVFREVGRALRPDGIFIVNEYVGPARFQVPGRQVELINSLLRELPEELRRLPGGGLKERFDPPRLAEIIRHDPSEAVRSHRILPLLRRHFVLTECVEYGGTILNWLLSGIIQNFRSDDPEHRKWLDWLYTTERAVLESGEFESDFAFVIAQRKPRGRFQD